MCRALNYLEELKGIVVKYDREIKKLKDRQKELELAITDIQHYLLDEKLNGYKGYLYAKKLQEILLERRKVKNEIDNLYCLKNRIDYKHLNDTRRVVNSKLSRQLNPKYRTRILDKQAVINK